MEMRTPVESEASCLSFSPHKESGDLLAVGAASEVLIKSCTLKDDMSSFSDGQSLSDIIAIEDLFTVLYSNAGHLSWSPNSSSVDSQFRFCASQKDKGDIIAFSSSTEDTTSESLPGHMAIVNDLCHHPYDDTLLVSVGDDYMCRVWDLQQCQVRSEFRLGSAGMSAKWNEQDPNKLMVAEKNGCVRFYDVSTDTPILSLACPGAPLISADWSPSNSQIVGGVAGGSWYIWNLSRSSRPLDCKYVTESPLTKFSWCCQSDTVFATLSASSQLKIHHLAHQRVPMSYDLKAATDISWHAVIPVVGVARDKEIICFIAET